MVENNAMIESLRARGVDIENMSAMEREYMGLEDLDTGGGHGGGNIQNIPSSVNGGGGNNGDGMGMLEIPMAISAEQYSHLGKYAGAIVLMCFEKIGGMEAFGDWARNNPTDFYTKMFNKVIATSRTVETNGGGSDDAMIALEADFRGI